MRRPGSVMLAILGAMLPAGPAYCTIVYTSAWRQVAATTANTTINQSFQSTDLLAFDHTVSAFEPFYGSGSSSNQTSSLDSTGVRFSANGTTKRGLQMSNGAGTAIIDVVFSLDGPTPTAIVGGFDYGNNGIGFLSGYIRLLSGASVLYEFHVPTSGMPTSQFGQFGTSLTVPAGVYRLQGECTVSGGGYSYGAVSTGALAFNVTVPCPATAAALLGGPLTVAVRTRRRRPAS